MRTFPTFLGLASLLGALGCSSPAGSLESAAATTNPASSTVPSAPILQIGGAGPDLESAAPLTDDELDRLLDALEQQIDKK
jgi:hypothetical protein